ncbi:hypothetical protein Ctob_001987 [Chrysochromulina tobinii]|uniref:Uncharacterized protein n=1 Tax=Chrysochromulina tobinii TaxID=1460289 RepID=A0A0M0JRZ1_9EUKA|nr:hypothetical protein Ctob_001987 [Chrysochromulina tobinii]|eukprot:KOO29359.1 hypothetical protein Ctob_001987 [Chrysochromulina sp. CCMP291]
MPKPTNKLTAPRPTTSVFSAQHIADVLALVCCAAVNDRASRLHPLLAVAGALSAPIALASLPVLLLGAASRTALCIVFAHLIAAALRWKALNMDEESAHPLDRPEAGLSGYVAAFTFVPEAVYRWAELRGAPWSVEVWHGTDGSSLHVGALPSPRHVRQLASAHANGAGPRVVVLNACRCTTRPVRVYLHCESGAYAACVAAAFVASVDESLVDGEAASARICSLTAGRLRAAPREAARLSKLVLSLSRSKRRDERTKAVGAVGAVEGSAPSGVVPGGGSEAAAAVADEDEDDEDDESEVEVEAAASEQRERWQTYQQAVAEHGTPGFPKGLGTHGMLGARHNAGGWTEVSTAPKRMGPGAIAESYAAKAAAAQAQSLREAREAQALTDKQRKNKRKQEKAKEETARREAERQARLQETIRQRARG